MDAINIIQSNLPRMNETSQEEHFGVSQVAETLGLFFYLINPIKSTFETIEECPDYVNQVGDPGRSLPRIFKWTFSTRFTGKCELTGFSMGFFYYIIMWVKSILFTNIWRGME